MKVLKRIVKSNYVSIFALGLGHLQGRRHALLLKEPEQGSRKF